MNKIIANTAHRLECSNFMAQAKNALLAEHKRLTKAHPESRVSWDIRFKNGHQFCVVLVGTKKVYEKEYDQDWKPV